MATKELAYTVCTSTFSSGAAGDLSFGSGTPPSVGVDKNQVGSLNGDPWVFSFYDNSSPPKLLVVVSQTVSSGNSTIDIYDPSTTPWTSVKSTTWSGVNNLQGVVTVGSYLYAINYGGTTGTPSVLKIALSTYSVSGTYTVVKHDPSTLYLGVSAILAVGSYVYVLVVQATNSGFTAYNSSFIEQFDTTATFPPTSTPPTAYPLGDNAVDIVPYGTSALFIPSIGGAQGSKQNAGTKVDRVTLSAATPPVMAVTSPAPLDSSDVSGNYYDLALSSGGAAYILEGLYNTAFSNFSGDIYLSSESNIVSGNVGSVCQTISSTGFYWHILYQNGPPDYFWFSRGNEIDTFTPPLKTTTPYTTPFSALAATALGTSPVNGAINSWTPLWTASGLLLRAGGHRGGSGSHARLAREARAKAAALKKQKK